MAERMTPEQARTYYASTAPRIKDLCDEAVFSLNRVLEGRDIKVSNLESRVKTETSFVDKCLRKGVDDPSAIRDLGGLRVVCLFLSDVPRIGQLLSDCFDIVAVDDKVEGYDASQFGYMSVHYIVKMKSSYAGPRYARIAGLPLEIQVRTLLMHAWANVSHYLSYKSDVDIPSELRRDFYAISGLFYVADRHFELFFQESVRSRAAASETVGQTGDLAVEINHDSLSAYLRSQYPDRSHGDDEAVSELVGELVDAGYSTLGEVDRDVRRAATGFERYEKDHPPAFEHRARQGRRRFADVGVIRMSVVLANEAVRRRDRYGGVPVEQYLDLVTPGPPAATRGPGIRDAAHSDDES